MLKVWLWKKNWLVSCNINFLHENFKEIQFFEVELWIKDQNRKIWNKMQLSFAISNIICNLHYFNLSQTIVQICTIYCTVTLSIVINPWFHSELQLLMQLYHFILCTQVNEMVDTEEALFFNIQKLYVNGILIRPSQGLVKQILPKSWAIKMQ